MIEKYLKQKEFGDFQTPQHLANDVVQLVSSLNGKPDIIVEPTCGLGNFLSAAHEQWGRDIVCEGFEISEEYFQCATEKFSMDKSTHIYHQDFFSFDCLIFSIGYRMKGYS